jgi:hypothetical protein
LWHGLRDLRINMSGLVFDFSLIELVPKPSLWFVLYQVLQGLIRHEEGLGSNHIKKGTPRTSTSPEIFFQNSILTGKISGLVEVLGVPFLI